MPQKINYGGNDQNYIPEGTPDGGQNTFGTLGISKNIQTLMGQNPGKRLDQIPGIPQWIKDRFAKNNPVPSEEQEYTEDISLSGVDSIFDDDDEDYSGVDSIFDDDYKAVSVQYHDEGTFEKYYTYYNNDTEDEYIFDGILSYNENYNIVNIDNIEPLRDDDDIPDELYDQIDEFKEKLNAITDNDYIANRENELKRNYIKEKYNISDEELDKNLKLAKDVDREIESIRNEREKDLQRIYPKEPEKSKKIKEAANQKVIDNFNKKIKSIEDNPEKMRAYNIGNLMKEGLEVNTETLYSEYYQEVLPDIISRLDMNYLVNDLVTPLYKLFDGDTDMVKEYIDIPLLNNIIDDITYSLD